MHKHLFQPNPIVGPTYEHDNQKMCFGTLGGVVAVSLGVSVTTESAFTNRIHVSWWIGTIEFDPFGSMC